MPQRFTCTSLKIIAIKTVYILNVFKSEEIINIPNFSQKLIGTE